MSLKERKNGKPFACLAFGEVAVSLCDGVSLGSDLVLLGSSKDGKFIINSFSFKGAITKSTQNRNKPEPYPPTRMDILVEELGIGRVNQRLRIWLGTDRLDVNKLVTRFDVKGYHQLLDELELECLAKHPIIEPPTYRNSNTESVHELGTHSEPPGQPLRDDSSLS